MRLPRSEEPLIQDLLKSSVSLFIGLDGAAAVVEFSALLVVKPNHHEQSFFQIGLVAFMRVQS